MKYKISKYLVIIPQKRGLLLFSTLSGGMLYLDDPKCTFEMNKMFSQNEGIVCCERNQLLFETLKNNQMIVGENIEETDIARMAFLNRYTNSKTLRLLIYVTDDCNFNCVYCPQKHVSTYMTEDTIDKVVSSVSGLLSHHRFEGITISWFGGEPLLNMSIIERGMQAFEKIARQFNLIIHSGITTNGYLLGDRTVSKLLKHGVNEYQITLDGDKLTHDKNRHLKNGGPTWEKIWNNLLLMKARSNEFLVNIRVNSNMDNIEFLPQFIEQVQSTFDKRFIIRIQPIIKMGMSTDKYELSSEVKYCSLLESQLIQLSMYSYMRSLKCEDLTIENVMKPFGLMCSCSDPNYFVIKTDGRICKCELEIEQKENYFGTIDGNSFNLDVHKLTNYVVPSTSRECLECNLYPMCLGLTCPYKRALGKSCSLKNTFMIDEFVETIAQKYISEKES